MLTQSSKIIFPKWIDNMALILLGVFEVMVNLPKIQRLTSFFKKKELLPNLLNVTALSKTAQMK
jgi:hypothetical protein